MRLNKKVLAIAAAGWMVTGSSTGLVLASQDHPHASVNQQNLAHAPNGDVLEMQMRAEQSILDEYKEGCYTLSSPFVVKDPYGWSPLTALVMFETDEQTQVTVEVEGKDEYTGVKHTFTEFTKKHQVPVYGLYAGTKNKVTITATDKDGNRSLKELTIETDPLPASVQKIDVKTADPEKMKERGVNVHEQHVCLRFEWRYSLVYQLR